MEACPKLPMIDISFKYARDSPNLNLVLKKIIYIQHQDNEDFSKEIQEFTNLRKSSVCSIAATSSSLDLLKKYYCQLHFVNNRFKCLHSPILMKKGPFDFPWMDMYTGNTVMFSNLNSEMANVLYNIGALHVALGNKEDRTSSESMKTACNHFQSAAWAFHTLPDLHQFEEITDYNSDQLAVLSQICLAQAQECILDKSILDHRKSSIITKVGAQVVDFYRQAHKKIESSKANLTSWPYEYIYDLTSFVKFKYSYYGSVSRFYMGIANEEESKWGDSVAYFKKAYELLQSIANPSQNSSEFLSKEQIKDTTIFAHDVIKGKYDIAVRENEFIYHEKVPTDLEELKGHCLVKGIGFEFNEENGGKDIFSRIIPLEAHTASSLYSEEKAKVLRDLGTKVDLKDESLEKFLASMNLEQVPNAGDHIALPQELIECAAELSGVQDKPVKKLSETMAKLAGISADVQAHLDSIQDIIEKDKQDAKEYKAIVGKNPKSLDQTLLDELDRYKEAHKVASESNQTLHKAMRLHLTNLKTLNKPLSELQTDIPSTADLDAEAEASIAEFQRIICKVNEMKSQRSKFMDDLREDMLSDDITKKLVLHKNKEMSEIFQSELTKHDNKTKIIEQNLLAQENIIRAMTEINAKYAPTRREVANLIEARKEKIQSLMDSFQAYENLLLKAKKAVDFYEQLNTNIQDLAKKVEKTMLDNEKEKDATIAKLTSTPKASTPMSHSAKPTLKDYLNAGGPKPNPGYAPYVPQTSMNPQGYPITTQGYNPSQPYSMPTAPQPYGQYPAGGVGAIRPSYQGYNPNAQGLAQGPAQGTTKGPAHGPAHPGYISNTTPTTQHQVGPPQGYQQPIYGQQQPQQFPPQMQQQQFGPNTNAGGQNPYYVPQNSSVNPNDLSLI